MSEVKEVDKSLKKCPFCGSGAKSSKNYLGLVQIECENCWCKTGFCQPYEAKRVWNSRVIPKIKKSDASTCGAFGIRLKKLREAQDIDIKDLAEMVGTSYFILKAIEQGKAQAEYSMIVSLAKALHVTTDYLLGNRWNQ